MIKTVQDFLRHREIRTDVAVVGAGPIGIAVALELARAGVTVALIESGKPRFTKAAQDLADFDSRQDDYFHASNQIAVRRQLGGTSKLWGGRCVMFDRIDFEHRPITTQAPWPITYDDIEPFIQKACDWAECGRAAFSVSEVSDLAGRQMIAGIDDDDVVKTTDLERWSSPTRFGRRYAKQLRLNKHLTLWTGLTCTEIVTTSEGNSVDHLIVKTLDGHEGRITANDYLLATGGLEATRLLMVSDRHHKNGLGNQGGHLGRWYMAHVEARVATAKFCSDSVIYDHERDNEGVYLRRRFTVSPSVQRELNLPNCALWLVNAPIGDPSHRSGILSGVYLTLVSPLGRLMLAEAIRKAHTKSDSPQITSHLKNVIRDFFPSVLFAVKFLYGRYLRPGRKIPGFFVKSADNRYPLHYHGEHLPHWESRVELTDERDHLGVRRIRTHLYFSRDDFEGVRRAVGLVDEYLRRHQAGHVEWSTEDIENSVYRDMYESQGFHQAGTTRMSSSPATGVVDGNLAVHGVRALYVASTSVLPTSSQANPTLMGLALGVRLAQHLIKQRRESPEKAVRQ